MKGKGTEIIDEIYEALQVFKHREIADHPLGEEYGAVMWTVRCLANPQNYERWLRPIIKQSEEPTDEH